MIVTYIGFNQDNSCVTIGTIKGLVIYSTEPIEKRYSENAEGVARVEMLYCTSLLLIVPSGDTVGSSPRRLKLIKTLNNEVICELPFNSAILAVKLNMLRMIVCLELSMHIYDIKSVACLQVLSTSANITGIISLSNEENSYLAFPSSNSGGDVILYDSITLKILSQFQAHKSDIAVIEFNRSGTLLATASKTGTVIRVFSTPAGELLHSFRRGSYPAQIYGIAFCPMSEYLCVSSSSGTIHIFSIQKIIPSTSSIFNQSPLIASSLVTAGRALWSYLPGVPVITIDKTCRAVATVNVSCAERGVFFKASLLISEVSSGDRKLKLAVLTMDGYLFRYAVSIDEAGDRATYICSLEDEELLLEE